MSLRPSSSAVLRRVHGPGLGHNAAVLSKVRPFTGFRCVVPFSSSTMCSCLSLVLFPLVLAQRWWKIPLSVLYLPSLVSAHSKMLFCDSASFPA